MSNSLPDEDHNSLSTADSTQPLTQQQTVSNLPPTTTDAASTTVRTTTVPTTAQLDHKVVKTSTSGRISIILSIIGFPIPLLNVLSYKKNSFLDTSSLSSIGLLSAYCILADVQFLYMVMKKPIDDYEIIVYALFLVAAIVLTSLMYHENYHNGVDGMKNYIFNLIGLSVSSVAVVYELVKEIKRL